MGCGPSSEGGGASGGAASANNNKQSSGLAGANTGKKFADSYKLGKEVSAVSCG